MPGPFDVWSRRPVEWDPSAALRSPHEWCSLSGWVSADALIRGAQAGPREPNRIWAIGLHRMPEQYLEVKAPRPPSPLVLVLPEAWRALCRAAGMVAPEQHALAVALVRADLCVPQRRCATLPVTLPRANGSYTRFYAFRGEITALCVDPGAEPAAQELAALEHQQLIEDRATCWRFGSGAIPGRSGETVPPGVVCTEPAGWCWSRGPGSCWIRRAPRATASASAGRQSPPQSPPLPTPCRSSERLCCHASRAVSTTLDHHDPLHATAVSTRVARVR